MRLPGFIGGTYTGQSPTPAGDRCQNFYPEAMTGAGAPENNLVLAPSPGLTLFTTIPGVLSVDAEYTEPNTGRVFNIAGGVLREVDSLGSLTTRGTVGSGPYRFASNALQMMITVSGGAAFILSLGSNTLTPISGPSFLRAAACDATDGYFVTIVPNSRTFQISPLNDGLTWSGLDIGTAGGGADNLVDFAIDHRELWLAGSRRIEIFVDTGNPSFPFERLQGVYIETGVVAGTMARLDNTLFWLEQNERGGCMVRKAKGYTPTRISNHSVEYFFSQYQKNGGWAGISAYGWEFQGHSFYRIDFPAATCDIGANGGTVPGVIKGATWVYDVATGMWHELFFWNNGVAQAHLARTHCVAFGGKHLVGDYQSGKIYEITSDAYDDAGSVIRRVRRAPHVTSELRQFFYHQFSLSAQVGAGNASDPNPECALRCSNDGGLTWGIERTRSLGKAGEYKKRVYWNNPGGPARRRAYEFSTTARVPVTLIDAFQEATPGTS